MDHPIVKAQKESRINYQRNVLFNYAFAFNYCAAWRTNKVDTEKIKLIAKQSPNLFGKETNNLARWSFAPICFWLIHFSYPS